jgi:hypothetical protein
MSKNAVLLEESENSLLNVQVLVRRPTTVFSAGDRIKLVRHARGCERFVQANGMLIRDGRVGISLRSKNRR